MLIWFLWEIVYDVSSIDGALVASKVLPKSSCVRVTQNSCFVPFHQWQLLLSYVIIYSSDSFSHVLVKLRCVAGAVPCLST
jgi:hypothetical protein